ncbi:MAG: FAD-dependent oxidoreductase [Pseudomonadota bacterium]
MTHRVVIAGGGQAAGELAADLVDEVAAGRVSVTIIGDEAHPPYQRPPLSKKYLTGEIAADRLILRDHAFYDANAITLALGTRVTGIDRAKQEVAISSGAPIAYDTLVLATGARVRELPVPGADLEGVFYLRSIADADALAPYLSSDPDLGAGESEPRGPSSASPQVVVIGGGYIGLEVAASAHSKGAKVTVVEAAERPLARVASAPFAADVSELHRTRGVTVLCGASVTAIEGRERVAGVRLGDGRLLPADIVVVGIGVIPNAELAERCELDTQGGILVDGQCGTNDPAIFAAGDVACIEMPGIGRTRLESVQNAVDQAKHIAATIRQRCAAPGSAAPSPAANYAPVPRFWSDQFDARLQIAGLARGDEAIVKRVNGGGKSYWHYRDDTLVAVETLNDARAFMAARRLLEAGRTPPRDMIADGTQDLKSLMKET